MHLLTLVLSLGGLATALSQSCPDYASYSTEHHGPYSSGRYNLSYQRPSANCRTFVSQRVEDTINRLHSTIKDPDLFRLFENSFPNTLDTAIKWKGTASGSDEELTFVITGDINAMWLRDSANQMQSYLSLLTPSSSPSSIASLYRGVINLQARYLLTSPYCNSFQPPAESGIGPSANGAANGDTVKPPYNSQMVFECKYELDSLAAFLEVSSNYYNATKDINFFRKYKWVDAVKAVLAVANNMTIGTYADDGRVNDSPYTYTRLTTRATETLANNGLGNPVQGGTGLIRSAFRPSDDSTIYQLYIPANMMFSRYLDSASQIMRDLGNQQQLTDQMHNLAISIRDAVMKNGIVNDPVYGNIFAFEIDGFGSRNIMDDANIPGLLSAPFFGFIDKTNNVYQATRKVILSNNNPYFMRGPVINAVGSPHDGPGYAWPMASIMRIFTTDDDNEITTTLKEIVSSTDGLGLIHESINSFNAADWTRQWFSWANGLFGQMILDLEQRKPTLLGQSYQ